MALEGLAGWEEAGVEGEDGDHLLLDIQPRLAAVGGTNFVQPEQITWRYAPVSCSVRERINSS